MRKLNEKGFAITTILYSMIMLVSLILFLLIGLQGFQYRSTSEFASNIAKELNEMVDSSYTPISLSSTFSYTGNIQTYTVPQDGLYQLKVWGAEGGSSSSCSGGKGGYAFVTIPLTQNTILYIGVGGAGTSTNTHQDQLGGYNGGGSAIADANGNTLQASGGGATHIALENGELSSLSSSMSSLLVVAGGGGGAGSMNSTACTAGGAGGGETGENGQAYSDGTITGTGLGGGNNAGGGFDSSSTLNASYTATGSFGLGATSAVAGGGGGYYGGGVAASSAGGGSSYAPSGDTIAGNASMPNYDSTATMIGNSGNGYASITYIGENTGVKDSLGNLVRYQDGSIMQVGDRFKIHYAANPSYVIDVYSAASSNGTKIQLYVDSSLNQSSYGVLEALTENYYAIYFYLYPNMVLDITNGSSELSIPLQLYTANFSGAQQWTFVKDGDYYQIQSLLGTCMDLKQAIITNGQVIQTYTCTAGNAAQRWYFEKV